MTPVDIITQAIRTKYEYLPDRRVDELADAVTEALTDERIVAHAAQALRDAGWCHDHVHGVRLLDDAQLDQIARVVLRSVGA